MKKDKIFDSINKVEGFTPSELLIEKEDGASFLPVRNRVLWFRLFYPKGKIIPEIISFDGTLAVMKATIKDETNEILATGHASAVFNNDSDIGKKPLECAETCAIGRALSNAGFGTQFSGTDYESDDLPDAPIDAKNEKKPSLKAKGPSEAKKQNKSGDSIKKPENNNEKSNLSGFDLIDAEISSPDSNEDKINKLMANISPTESKGCMLSYGKESGKDIKSVYSATKTIDALMDYAYPSKVDDAHIYEIACARVFVEEVKKLAAAQN